MKKNEMEIQPLPEVSQYWPANSFYQAYRPKMEAMTVDCFLVSSKDSSLSRQPKIIFRTFIENGYKIIRKQRYVIAIRFYAFGSLATIDLISTSLNRHKDIVKEHIKNLSDYQFKDQLKTFNSLSSSFLIIGGHLKIEDENLNFFGGSGHFGANIQSMNANDMASFITAISVPELKTGGGADSYAEDFIGKLLKIMGTEEKDFYETFFNQLVVDTEESQEFMSKKVSALLMMKVIDRTNKERVDLFPTLLEEMVGGFNRQISF